MIPTFKECWELQDRYNMFHNIRQHSANVMFIACYLADRLNGRCHSLDMDLLAKSSLLHDITKTHHLVAPAFFHDNQQWLEENESLVPGTYDDILFQWEDIKMDLDVHEGICHPETGGKLLSCLGYPDVGYVVSQHNQPLVEISECALLCYADRVIGFNRVVTVDERFNYVLKKYGEKWVDRLKDSTKELEKLILEKAGLEFEQLQNI